MLSKPRTSSDALKSLVLRTWTASVLGVETLVRKIYLLLNFSSSLFLPAKRCLLSYNIRVIKLWTKLLGCVIKNIYKNVRLHITVALGYERIWKCSRLFSKRKGEMVFCHFLERGWTKHLSGKAPAATSHTHTHTHTTRPPERAINVINRGSTCSCLRLWITENAQGWWPFIFCRGRKEREGANFAHLIILEENSPKKILLLNTYCCSTREKSEFQKKCLLNSFHFVLSLVPPSLSLSPTFALCAFLTTKRWFF